MPFIANNFDEFADKKNLSVVLNTEGLYFLIFDKQFNEIVTNADLIFVDGVGVKIALFCQGFRNVRRLHGPDLFHEMLHRNDGKRRLILGGSARSHLLLTKKYPDLKNDGGLVLNSDIIDVNNISPVFELIEKSDPDEIYVCLGIRKQEIVASMIKQEFPQLHLVGVGASIDYESGNVVRSSRLMQKIGLEWLPRLIREPRMIPRQSRALIGFLCFVFGKYIGKKSDFRTYDISMGKDDTCITNDV